MKLFQKTINGIPTIEVLNRIIIEKDGMNIYNPTEEMVILDGWIEYKIPEKSESDLIQQAKDKKIAEIEEYDSSPEVNICHIRYINDMFEYWADKSERNDLKAAVNDCINIGREKYRLDLRKLRISMEVNCKDLINMLSLLEVYAIDCYNVTTDHIYAVYELNNVEDINNYDYRQGYPDKLIFDL